MHTRKFVFQSVIRSESVKYTCSRCGKKRSKIIRTEHTINPFNKNSDGIPKSHQEVAKDVQIKQAEKVAKAKAGDMCNKCKDEMVAERNNRILNQEEKKC